MMRIVISALRILCLLLITGTASIGQHNQTKEVDRSAAFSENGVFSIENKYGDITIRSWAKDSVRIHATIKTSSKSRDRLAMLDKRSRVSIYLNSDFADVKTVVDESTLAKEWRNIKNMATSGGDQIVVDYVIDVPRSVKLEIVNRFGNTYIDNHSGRINIDSEHGDVRLGKAPQLEDAHIAFGKLFAREVGRPELEMNFCDLDVGKATSLKIHSKSSTMHIGQVGNVYLRSTRDKVTVKKVKNIDLVGTLTKLEVGKITGELNVTIRYGKIWVQEVMPETKSLRIKPKNSTVYLNFNGTDKVKTTVKGEEISIDYDRGMGELKKNGKQYEGYLGSTTGSDRTLYISGEKSSFTIDFENK